MNAKLIYALGLAAAASVAAPALAQMRPGPLVLLVHPLPGSVYWVEGGPSNTGFVIGDNGVVVVDPQMFVDAAKVVIGDIAEITPKPVNDLILTHADPDHVGGIPAYPPGTTIIAQENAKSIIRESIADPSAGPRLGPMYAALAPFAPNIQTISAQKTEVLDGVRMVFTHVAPAHTSGDLTIYMPDKKIVFAGDILVTNMGPYPVVHPGGSSLGWIATMKALLALDADTFVPGHGPIETRPMLEERLRAAEDRRDQVKAMVDAGKTLDEVVQALPEPPIDPRFLPYTQVVYNELTKGYPPAVSPWLGLLPVK